MSPAVHTYYSQKNLNSNIQTLSTNNILEKIPYKLNKVRYYIYFQ